MRFGTSSLMCTAVDQSIAWMLFSTLDLFMPESDFLRILFASVVARLVSLTLNYSINLRLVFGDDTRDRRTFMRFLALAACVLALSTLGVYFAHTALGAPEWQAKIVVDLCLFFLNYNVQRAWVFRKGDEPQKYAIAEHL